MVYQAMFDEVDEGTAIFKCTNDPPVGASTFLNYEGLPSDHYLRVVGAATRLLRGDLPPATTLYDVLRPLYSPETLATFTHLSGQEEERPR